ncbi:MAG: hypothetical protein WD554_06370 [Flavobacteriaceae bacterium]
MENNQITYLLNHPEALKKEHQMELDKLLADFPYFQPARALYLKCLKDQNSYTYNAELKKTAAHTTDRSVLFEYITSETFIKEETLSKEESEKELKKAEAILNPNLFEKKGFQTEQEKAVEEILGVHKPLPFSRDDKHSFQEWLKLTRAKPIDRGTEQPNQDAEKKEKFKLIDKFIQENPKIDPKNSVSETNLAKPFSESNEHLMTETLAKVYVQQNNYKKAIQAYKILILKNPEKSGFFADQIRAIEKLQQHN